MRVVVKGVLRDKSNVGMWVEMQIDTEGWLGGD
jgi:hypothetical protein